MLPTGKGERRNLLKPSGTRSGMLSTGCGETQMQIL